MDSLTTPVPRWLIEHAERVIRETVEHNEWIPVTPWPKQLRFLATWEQEAFFGGAGGGAKSWALLMAALQYVNVPGYTALILRRNLTQLQQPGGLIDISHEWLRGTNARWKGDEYRWTFPSGAILKFGHIETERDKTSYDGSRFAFVGFDEATGFTESMYTYLFSRMRKARGLNFPIRMRATGMPGNIGHMWVRNRFVRCLDKRTKKFDAKARRDRAYIPAKLDDNPGLDTEQYLQSLSHLDPVTRQRIRNGDWEIAHQGGVFSPEGIELQQANIVPGQSGVIIAA
jgi:hypothetical protein